MKDGTEIAIGAEGRTVQIRRHGKYRGQNDPLTDNRDRLKKGRDDLESAKLDKVQEHNTAGRPDEQKARDRETIETLDKTIDRNHEARDEVDRAKKRKKFERENEEDPFLYDPRGTLLNFGWPHLT